MSIVNKALVPVIISGVLLSGCSMNKVVEKEAENQLAPTEENSKKEAKVTKDNAEIETVEDFEFNEGQEKLLDEAESQTAEQAVDYNEANLSVRTELTNIVPVEKEAYKDTNEAIQYFSYQFFRYHAALIDGEEFYRSMKNHFSPEFLELMPEKEEDRILMFMTLQEAFSSQLTADIEKYAATEITYSEMKNEGYFFRKYTLANGDEIFYQTLVKKVEDKWKVIDDEPSTGYAIGADGDYTETFTQNKE